MCIIHYIIHFPNGKEWNAYFHKVEDTHSDFFVKNNTKMKNGVDDEMMVPLKTLFLYFSFSIS